MTGNIFRKGLSPSLCEGFVVVETSFRRGIAFYIHLLEFRSLNVQVLRKEPLQSVKLLSVAGKLLLQVMTCHGKDHLAVKGVLVALDQHFLRFNEVVGIILRSKSGMPA